MKARCVLGKSARLRFSQEGLSAVARRVVGRFGVYSSVVWSLVAGKQSASHSSSVCSAGCLRGRPATVADVYTPVLITVFTWLSIHVLGFG